jgi:tRNA pseudouridine55 synthase
MASGLLALCFGEATKFAGAMLDADKAYRARVRLGLRTSTGDAEGEPLERRDVRVGREQLESVLERFRGSIEQTPPMYSAIKHRGRPLYAYARKGETVERTARKVVIRELVLEGTEGADVELRIVCSKGTYIRVLAEDLGEALGCGAHLAALQRTAVGPFTLDHAVSLDELAALAPAEREARLLPVDALVASWPRVALQKDIEARFCHGQRVPAGTEEVNVAVFGADGRFLGIGEVDRDGILHPRRLVMLKHAADAE